MPALLIYSEALFLNVLHVIALQHLRLHPSEQASELVHFNVHLTASINEIKIYLEICAWDHKAGLLVLGSLYKLSVNGVRNAGLYNKEIRNKLYRISLP